MERGRVANHREILRRPCGGATVQTEFPLRILYDAQRARERAQGFRADHAIGYDARFGTAAGFQVVGAMDVADTAVGDTIGSDWDGRDFGV